MSSDPRTRAGPSARRSPGGRGIAALRVLIVDDDDDSAESLALLVRHLGSEARIAGDGPTALASVVRHRPHLVLLDLGLPGMGGYEVARRTRALSEGRDALLVAVTGWSQTDAGERGREAGFDHHLVKPLELDDLRRLLAAAAKACADD